MGARLASLAATLPAAIVAALAASVQPPPSYDVILRHGTVIDGSGLPRYRADVAIAGGSIARLGNLDGVRAAVDLDVTGLFVTPGFLNIHSHATPDGLTTAVNMLTQGVTTEILNADGAGPIDIGEQLTRAETRGLAVNVGANIGFNSVWSEVVGLADRRASADEIARMRTLVTDGLARGAWGVSAGLDYKPAYYAQGEEVIKVIEPAKAWRTNFINHDRVTPESGFSSRAGMAETIAIGERAGLTPVITHMKVQGHEQGSADLILAEMRKATARGAYTAADAYPYLAGQTGLVALIIPGWAQDGGRAAMLARFADPAQRARIVTEAEAAMDARFGGAAGIYLPATKQELVNVMRDMQVSAGEAVVRLLEQSSPGIIARFGVEADLVKILQHPTTSIACDCGAVAREASHPRYYGTFPRVLGHYTRDQQALTWEDAVRKMTGLPAATIGMVDRGRLADGMAADVVAFDPATVIDHATFDEPTRPSDGIRFVLVNGRIALRDGKPTDERGGRALFRTAHMPTRPMTVGQKQRLSQHERLGTVRIALDLTQDATAPRASGTFQFTDPAARVAIDMKEIGVLQTFGRWASFTGRAALRRSDEERSMTVTIDGTTLVIDAGPTFNITRELGPQKR
jgi:N-acyl-D-aspartate/D-glutamate deacylase